MTVDVDNRSCFQILCMEINRAQLNDAGIGLCFELNIMLLFCVFQIETVGVPSCDLAEPIKHLQLQHSASTK